MDAGWQHTAARCLPDLLEGFAECGLPPGDPLVRVQRYREAARRADRPGGNECVQQGAMAAAFLNPQVPGSQPRAG